MNTPSFKEDEISQVPALQLLQHLGYIYLTQAEAFQQRGQRLSNVLLEGVLEDQLHRLNKIRYKGSEYKFTGANIRNAVQALKDFPLKDGLIRTSEKVYDLLTLGKSFEQLIDGDKKSFNIKYIDWDEPKNNVYHVTEEFAVERTGSQQTYRPDIVLFVNGIPLTVIECKAPHIKEPVNEAISQHLRNQKMDGIPSLFIYSQLLMSLGVDEAKYATTGTSTEFWATWKEQYANKRAEKSDEEKLHALINKKPSRQQQDKLFIDRSRNVREYFEERAALPVQATEQERLLYRLCRPERLMELVYRFLVYDAGEKKIARYQQYFAVKNTISHVRHLEDGRRKGGVVWHTQGSGKSLTMVMLAKSIALEKSITDPKIILVTDRIDLDDQIYKTFRSCGKDVKQARTGSHLTEMLHTGKDTIITTIINKFDAVVNRGQVSNTSHDIFVLIDETHRSQSGIANINMQRVFPNACFIGFTGTPLMKKEKNTARQFGGFIDKYTIDQAVKDQAVVPLLYEGRHVIQDVNSKPLDAFFEMVSEPLNKYEKADLKKKFSRADQLNEADQKIWRTAFDISKHFRDELKGTKFRAQLAAPSKAAALKYKRYIDEINMVRAEVVISPPDTREGHEQGVNSIYKEAEDKVQQFWKIMMEKYGNERNYNKTIINAFKHDDEGPEMLIVVDKLLTGFDAPRNQVLYITRSLQDHTLLQAIARVNRLFEGKSYGFIIDYYGILGSLDKALTTYSSLSEFDEDDLAGALTNVKEEIKKLGERHAHLWDIFKAIPNKLDQEAYAQLLGDKALRDQFYDALSLFARTLKIALSTHHFSKNTAAERIERYTEDARFFLKLRVLVNSRYSDTIDYKQYEAQIQKLIDTHITSDEVIKITEQVNIFEKEKFEQEVEKIEGTVARADTIASRTARHISEKMEEDPAFYKKFSKMLEEVIEEHKLKRISDAEYLNKVKDIMHTVQDKSEEELPPRLRENDIARAFYGIVLDMLNRSLPLNGPDFKDIAVETGIAIDQIVLKHKVVDWQQKQDVQNRIKHDIEDFLYNLRNTAGIALDFAMIDEIIETTINIAKKRYS